MTSPLPFTDNYRDLSNSDGYQFEFSCERCGNGYRSAFRRSVRKTGGALLRGVGSFLGGRGSSLAYQASEALDRGTNSSEKDSAMRAAVTDIAPQFVQCRGCGDWVCEQVCWNDSVGQCARCTPIQAEQLAQLQAQARQDQMREALRNTSLIDGVDVSQQSIPRCPSCQAQTTGGKFCGSCGSALAAVRACGGCQAQNPAGAVFCSECGGGLI
ncbi:zinc ribbon domain-containing protein [Gordonia sp. (in: high G+C Gram-positive bacteria)]|uniref:zinc ribbon domain-containing protein n=1 Tax=Gordonia sp. (in: high G+C Gram-positive bacteria) TaxID=84139 RepID=UPI0016938920|nr:zinc ribbon domain-containing protein [Gordonia sp. (in: high G+C Gram-positive bacteria)]NLG47445.1 zinc ribbon domain-containing protein [Gordonia sp. (in: high G+C Gram-positive bacteria)]